jgi:hypothetical protein
MFTNLFKKSKPFILIDSYHQPTLQYPTLLVLSIDRKDLESYCKQAIKDGFRNPIITTKVYETIFETPKLVFEWNDKTKIDLFLQEKMLENCMKNTIKKIKLNKNQKCSIKLQLSKNACEYLYNHTRYIKFRFGNKMEQRELSGAFVITSIIDNVYTIDVDESSVQRGDKESVGYVNAFGTFHTHPYDAYEKYNVCIAWPSADDFLSFYYMYGLCYSGFHIVSTLEGIYVISLKKYISPEKVIKTFSKRKNNLEYNHGVDYPETEYNCDIEKGTVNYSKIKKYVKRMNKKGKFNLVFVKWENCDQPFYLRYAHLKNNCLLTTEQATNLKNIS